ncbi:MAG: glycoside hydrolase family 3 C-terminal domain-containing protein [Oscillospiraceae bacterium]|nr:glycoside hydrolase family 3 C-terminal domain-containing protein [Oscillospiraceae bacterium]
MSEYSQRARELVARMTLEEKVSQMLHGAAAIERLDVPAYNWWNEALHGVARAGTATMFPQAIALAAMFDPRFLEEIAGAISDEGRAKHHAHAAEGDRDIYKGLTFWSPNINIFRDPRWGRGHETYGEDPYLTARLGAAFIRGLQGPDREQLKSAACAKHFAVHSGPEDLRHEFDAVCDDYDLWNTYLPAFKAAVDAGVEAVMGAYNRTNGEPCCGSQTLLVDILRGKWGFDGHVTSDCWAVKDFHEFHKVTDNAVESVALAIRMGCDLNCGNLYGYAVQAVRDGLLTEEEVTISCERLMVARMRLGMLGAPENPKYTSIPYDVVDCAAHRALNLDAARRSLVLLKNDGTLPLDASQLKSIAVIGPNADSRRALEGNYEGTASEYFTVLEGVRHTAEGVRIRYAEGCHLHKTGVSNLALSDDRLAEAVIAAKSSDAVILCLGLDADIEGEEGDAGNEFGSGDKKTLNLAGRQQHLLETVTAAAAGKPVILVLISGSALAVGWADRHVNGILQAFYPGALGGLAAAEAIFGKFSPEGRLPVTFYRDSGDVPAFTDYSMKGRTYRYFEGEALYPFGFGLGYTRTELSGLRATRQSVSLTVRNIGELPGRETVQVYVSSPGQKEIRSLCGIGKVYLQPGESREVTVPLNPDAFSRRDSEGDLYPVAGPHTLYAGLSQPDKRSVALCGVEPLQAVIED